MARSRKKNNIDPDGYTSSDERIKHWEKKKISRKKRTRNKQALNSFLKGSPEKINNFSNVKPKRKYQCLYCYKDCNKYVKKLMVNVVPDKKSTKDLYWNDRVDNETNWKKYEKTKKLSYLKEYRRIKFK
jgi:ribosomal protein L34E